MDQFTLPNARPASGVCAGCEAPADAVERGAHSCPTAVGIDVGHDHLGASLREHDARRPSLPARSAGHDRHSILQLHVHVQLLTIGLAGESGTHSALRAEAGRNHTAMARRG